MGPAGAAVFGLLLSLALATTTVEAWGPQAHRLIARIATEQLTDTARANVSWLLGSATLMDVATWADQDHADTAGTSAWHYVNIPPGARTYDRNRDCPAPRGVNAADRGARFHDCVVDRISYARERLASTALARSDRVTALNFLVHLVGDVHQPFHAIGVERGGNGIPVRAFGSSTCGSGSGRRPQCNLHGVWDTTLVAHRQLSDRRYMALLQPYVMRYRNGGRVNSTPEAWAMESHDLAEAAMLRAGADAGDAYFRTQIPVIDERLALGGLRLAVLLNRSLTTPPPRR